MIPKPRPSTRASAMPARITTPNTGRATTSGRRASEITALAAMDEQERQEIVDRAVAGAKVSAAKTQRAANIRSRTKRSAYDYNHGDPDAEDHETGAVPELIPDRAQPEADDRDVAAPEGWLPRYEAVKARQAA